uniref:Uncharacterized protein n=1 Tax=Equus asinus TaxID=9793 RepID=A0A8C4PJ46_EQUAS
QKLKPAREDTPGEGCIRGREIEWREGLSCHQGHPSHLPLYLLPSLLLGHYSVLWGC